MQETNIVLPRHYPQAHQYEIRLLFQLIMDNIREKTRSNYLDSFKYYIYMNRYDIEQESILVLDDEIKQALKIVLDASEKQFVFHAFKENGKLGKIFLYMKSSASNDETFNNLLLFTFQMLLLMKKDHALPESLSLEDLELLAYEINEMILKK